MVHRKERHRFSILIAVAGLSVLWSATDAYAQRGAQPALHAPFPVDPTALEIASLEVVLDCTAWKEVGLECQTSATYRVVNPTAEAVAATLEIRSALVEVSVDGAAVKVSDSKLDLSVDAGATRTMVTTKRVRMWPRSQFNLMSMQTLALRHLAYGDVAGPGPLPSMMLPGVPAGRWGRIGDAVYTARYPSSFSKLYGWEHADAGGRRVATLRRNAGGTLYFAPKRGPRTWQLLNGGPFVDLGGTFSEGFRAALGYEIGFSRWLFASATAETHFDDVILTPGLEASFWFPGFGVGAGAPVRVHPDPEVGARAQVMIVFMIGFVVTVDYWPSDDVWRTTLSGRLGI